MKEGMERGEENESYSCEIQRHFNGRGKDQN
jgi:hypothetical protein